MRFYVVEINGHSIRTLHSQTLIKVGSVISDEIWIGNKIPGGIVTKIICKG